MSTTPQLYPMRIIIPDRAMRKYAVVKHLYTGQMGKIIWDGYITGQTGKLNWNDYKT